MFSEKQASCSNKSCRQQLFSSYKPIPSRQYIAWSGPSTRLVSADNSISDGPQHICRRGRFIPDTIIYSLHADGWFTWEMFTRLHCPLLGLCNCKYIMPEFAGYYKFLFFPYLCILCLLWNRCCQFPGQNDTKKRAASFENRPDERRSGTTRNRTGDTRIFSPLLYQLSYGTIFLQYFLVFVSTLPELRCKGSAFILFLQTFLNIFPCVHIL